MAQQASFVRGSQPLTMIQRQDVSIMNTNNSSIVSKRSVERLYFPDEPQFYRYFVKKPHRRSPLINRGYWLRMRAVDHAVQQFLDISSSKQKVIVNLGCGYDPLFWQSAARYGSLCAGVKFIDVDYDDLMIKKRQVVQNTTALKAFLTNVKEDSDGCLLVSNEYLQIGCDLHSVSELQDILERNIDLYTSLILFVAEVSITYMDVDASDALIAWAAALPFSRFCLLEQILPSGEDHPFAQTMLAHFTKFQTPLKAVKTYSSTSAQHVRFQTLGWPVVSVRNLWELWSAEDVVSPAERAALDAVEPFDEHEEFALFGCHYILLVADSKSVSNEAKSPCINARSAVNGNTANAASSSRISSFKAAFVAYPRGQGHRRFAAALPIRGSKSFCGLVGNFAGMDSNSRSNTIDVCTAIPTPQSRMCHTITDLGDSGSLIVGGRTSPDNALADCWLYHKWLNIFEKVDSLPAPRYRHFAVHLGNACVLVGGGKMNSQTIIQDYYVWSRGRGWKKCSILTHDRPRPFFGALSIARSPASCSGIIAGGLTREGTFQEGIWKWEVSGVTCEEPTINFVDTKDVEFDIKELARFGASVVEHQGHAYVVGGIIADRLLTRQNEICKVDLDNLITEPVSIQKESHVPRPLLIGVSAIFTPHDSGALLIIGGSAVCFSFGTFWNDGCYTLRDLDDSHCDAASDRLLKSWELVHSNAVKGHENTIDPAVLSGGTKISGFTGVSRILPGSLFDFQQVILSSKPSIIQGLNIGPCVSLWTAEYLKERIGSEREVCVHKSPSKHMTFEKKNFTYASMKFAQLIDGVLAGRRLYLRSLSSEDKAGTPTELAHDFPEISEGFTLPTQLQYVVDNAHSSPLRISGPVNMWLHYDIRGTKRVMLFPPSDVKYLRFTPGASSSSIDVFDSVESPIFDHTHPYEALLQPGDILYVPPFWAHAVMTTSSDLNVAINVFFRNLQAGYATGRDVYGNRDLRAYEKGRQDIARITKSFDGLPADARDFYLQRLLQEFENKST